MADKGFTIEELPADRGDTLIIPPFKMTGRHERNEHFKLKLTQM